MDESFQLLELDFCRVKNQINTLIGNIYSNPSLDEYQDNLFVLFHKLENEFNSASCTLKKDINKKIAYTKILEIVSLSIQFLEDSILNSIPFETAFCLKKALSDWSEEKYTFVTSHKDRYYFSQRLSLDENTFKLIENHCGVNFSNRLIQIGIPKHEVNDYFLNVVLYHELGHFIDLKYAISESIVYQEYPELDETESQVKINHFQEYFADIFAAQYVDVNVLRYLEYTAAFEPESDSHPSTDDRSDVIYAFLDNDQNDIIDALQNATYQITSQNLAIRYKEVSKDDFFNFIPPIIKLDEELHGLFVTGWSLWIDEREKFNEPDSFKVYSYINNLIEKSISNYMVKSLWDKTRNTDVSQ